MLDKIYEDFTTKMLPTIQEGLVITKDYFLDLFGRYVQYLIIFDSFQVVVSLLALFAAYKSFHRFKAWVDSFEDGNPGDFFCWFAFVIYVLFFFLSIVSGADDLLKDIFIPEVRIYEELKSFNK